MIIIYHCYGSAHSLVLAAGIHTGMLSSKKEASKDEIINLPFYDKTPSKFIGIPFYFGQDKGENKVYILGMGKAKKTVKNLLDSFLELEEIDKEEILLVNSLKHDNIFVRIGGFLSRRLGLIFPGRSLTVYGLKMVYFDFVETVNQVKKKIGIA